MKRKSRKIPLTQGRFALVDDEDYLVLMEYTWCAMRNASRKIDRQFVAGRNNGKTVLMHREILLTEKGDQLDHIDGDPLNNSRSNLRIATNSENQRNRLGVFAAKEAAAAAYDEAALRYHGEFARPNGVA